MARKDLVDGIQETLHANAQTTQNVNFNMIYICLRMWHTFSFEYICIIFHKCVNVFLHFVEVNIILLAMD